MMVNSKLNSMLIFRDEVRKLALDMALFAGKKGCHIGGSFSALEILSVLYGAILKYDVNLPEWENRDRFVASKAHCILTHFSALAHAGFFPKEYLNSFSENGGKLAGHPMNIKFGLEFSGGSLGMGLSIGVGMAIDAKEKKRNHRVFVLLGDGECDEGSIWEAIMAAPKFQLNNLVVIVDHNNLQYDGTILEVMDLGNLENKFRAFGWDTCSVDGHDIQELLTALSYNSSLKPYVIIANTVKAHSIQELEGKVESHHAQMTVEMYEKALLWGGISSND